MEDIFFTCTEWNKIPKGIKESILKLRYDVFVTELKWHGGLNIYGNSEMDQYDTFNATYLYSIDENNEVNATCRLIPTTKPYMLNEIYPHSISNIQIPCTDKIWEISRFCASVDLRHKTKNKITALIVAAIIEFGLKNNIQNYIALATDSILPVIRRFAGWDPTPIGELIATPDDNSYAIIYTVSNAMLNQVKMKAGIDPKKTLLQ
jgi:acyl homoserine lactone synthase